MPYDVWLKKAREVLESGGHFGLVEVPNFRNRQGKVVYKVRLFQKSGEQVDGVSDGTFRKLQRCKIIQETSGNSFPKGAWFLADDVNDLHWLEAGNRSA